MNVVSKCCHKPIVPGIFMEYPLGGSTWGINEKAEICEGCGMEAEPVEICDCCGLTPDHRGFVKVDGYDYCRTCAEHDFITDEETA